MVALVDVTWRWPRVTSTSGVPGTAVGGAGAVGVDEGEEGVIVGVGAVGLVIVDGGPVVEGAVGAGAVTGEDDLVGVVVGVEAVVLGVEAVVVDDEGVVAPA